MASWSSRVLSNFFDVISHGPPPPSLTSAVEPARMPDGWQQTDTACTWSIPCPSTWNVLGEWLALLPPSVTHERSISPLPAPTRHFCWGRFTISSKHLSELKRSKKQYG